MNVASGNLASAISDVARNIGSSNGYVDVLYSRATKIGSSIYQTAAQPLKMQNY